MRGVLRALLALAGCLVLAACAPDAPRSVTTTAAAGPLDDYELIVGRFGAADAEDSTDHDVPRPPIPTKWITYQREHVRFLFVPDAKLGDAPPYRWKLIGTTDPRSKQPIEPGVAVRRLAERDRNPGSTGW